MTSSNPNYLLKSHLQIITLGNRALIYEWGAHLGNIIKIRLNMWQLLVLEHYIYRSLFMPQTSLKGGNDFMPISQMRL